MLLHAQTRQVLLSPPTPMVTVALLGHKCVCLIRHRHISTASVTGAATSQAIHGTIQDTQRTMEAPFLAQMIMGSIMWPGR